MQTSTQTVPAPPPAPEAPSVQATPRVEVITTTGAGGAAQTIAVPRTRAEVDALLRRRSEISDQLASVTSRRRELVSEIRSAPDGVARTGLEERMKVLDQRIMQLETDLSVVGRELAAAPADLVSYSETRPQSGDPDAFEEGMAIGLSMIAVPLVLVLLWRRFRRKRRPTAKPAAITESDGRLERLERGMEAIAIEIERVSEGQRFVTRLLSESRGPAARVPAESSQHEA